MNSTYFEMPLNMDRVCRICLTEATNLSPIFGIDQDVSDFSGLSKKIQICGSIDIHEEDGLPSLICDMCIYKASVAHEFRQQCQHSDAKLRIFYNKPNRYNYMDSSTQTDSPTRIILTANNPEDYYVKEEMVAASEPQTLLQPSHNYCEKQDAITTELDMQDDKLFMCTENLTESATVGNDSFVQENDVQQLSIFENGSQSTVNNMDKSESLQVKTMEIPSLVTIENKINEPSNNVDKQNLEPNIEHDESLPQKRTSARKIKSVSNSFFSDDEFDGNYYDDSSDSQSMDGKKFKCKICDKCYATQKGLKRHSLIHDKKHKCDVCSKTFYKEENLEKHKKIHETKPHACQLCCACFSKSQSLVRHLKSHTEKVNDIIKQINIIEQKDDAQPEQELKNDGDSDNELPKTETDDFEDAPELYKCDICSQYCSSLKNLKRHTLVHGEKKYSCTVCKKWFFRPDTLKKHAEKHGHGLLDNLVEDNKLYDSDDDPFPHEKSNIVQEKENPKKDDSDEEGFGEFKCQHCDKVMATKKGLRRHVSMHKPKAEPVMCEICKKVCASQARLILHQRTHKPKEKVPREYLCHICSKVYPSNSSLTYHMRTHTGVKPHVCKTCNSGFTTTTSLANHIRIHTGDKPFVCHVCSAAFAVSSAFRRHLTRHTGEANYLCKTCGKAFKRLSTLKEHTYTHSGEKPYVCKTCGAAYSHSGSLFAHQKRCRAQYGDMVVDDQNHHHNISHIHVNNVQSAVRSLTVIGQMY